MDVFERPIIQFVSNQLVEYYSASHDKWYETTVVCVNDDMTLDLACRKGVDPSVVRARQKPDASAHRPSKENVSSQVNVSQSSHPGNSTPFLYQPGSKVEYYSDTMNGWVLSLVQSINPDGTYQLNTKQSADPSRIRALASRKPLDISPRMSARLPQPTVPTQSPPSVPGPYITKIRYRNTSDLSMYRLEILSLLSLASTHSIVRMSGFSGGQNEGIYFIYSTVTREKIFCLKGKGTKLNKKFNLIILLKINLEF